MGKHTIRNDKTCLNCNYVAENRFCPNCGQENVETRKTFHHLFIHFFEDLTHYENAFWITIRNLIFRPASLTREYLSGKRMSYLAPVRLYIFISFVTFLFVAIGPEKKMINVQEDNKAAKKMTFSEFTREQAKIAQETDTTGHTHTETNINFKDNKDKVSFGSFGYASVRELDSMQKFGKPEDKLGPKEYWFMKKAVTVAENNTTEELLHKFKESFIHNLPKVLFIYMPIFALFLWLFQNKKKWYYFDHGIFTLHYFSFLLLVYLILSVIGTILDFCGDFWLWTLISGVLNFVGFVWMFYYFFPAHHRFYGETRGISFLKGTMLFFINMFFITFILVIFAIYTFLTLQ